MIKSEYKYICTANCPELDLDGDNHCKCVDPAKFKDCPCGNEMKWEPIKENT